MGGRGRGRDLNNLVMLRNKQEKNDNFVDSRPRRTKPFRALVGFANDPNAVESVELLLRCVHCHMIPHPSHYMTCDNCGMISCGDCSIRTDRLQAEPCPCEPGTLRKGNELFLKVLIDNCLFECENKPNGCDEKIRGADWEDHVKNKCAKKDMLACRYKPCKSKTQRDDVFNHLVDLHHVRRFVWMNEKAVQLELPYSENEAHRWITIVSFIGIDYVFAAQALGENMHMWVWDVNKKKDGQRRNIYMCRMKPTKGISFGETRFKAECQAYDKPAESIIEEILSFSLSLKKLQKWFVTPVDEAVATEDHSNGIISNNLGAGVRKWVVEVVVLPPDDS